MNTKLVSRVKRFFKGLKVKIYEDDLKLIEEYLEEEQKKLFFSMSLFDQRHCLDVAKTLLNSDKKPCRTTIKLALLHDIGKQIKPFYLLERVLVVVIPRKNLELSLFPVSSSPLKKPWQLKYNHPEYGANLAEKQNLDPYLVDLIRYHHHYPPKTKEIEKFQWSDNLN